MKAIRLIRLILFMLAAAAVALGEDSLTLRMEPGCFTGPPRSLLTANPTKGAWIQKANEEREWKDRKLIRTKEEAAKAFNVLRKTPFSAEELKLLAILGQGTIGPGRFYLTITLKDRTTKLSYLADMTYASSSSRTFDLDLDYPQLAGKKKQIESLLAKVRKVHAALTPLIPNQ